MTRRLAAQEALLALFAQVGPGTGDLVLQRLIGTPISDADRLVFRGGRLIDWLPGLSSDAEAALWHATHRDAWTFAAGIPVGADGLRTTMLALRSTDQTWRRVPCPPAHLVCRPWGVGDTVPNADVTIAVELTSTPFGTVDYWMAFRDGRLRGGGLGDASEPPDMQLTIPGALLTEFHLGDRDLLSTLADSPEVHMGGSWPALSLAGGLMESEWFSPLWLSRCPAPAARLYAQLCRLLNDRPYIELRAMSLPQIARLGLDVGLMRDIA